MFADTYFPLFPIIVGLAVLALMVAAVVGITALCIILIYKLIKKKSAKADTDSLPDSPMNTDNDNQ